MGVVGMSVDEVAALAVEASTIAATLDGPQILERLTALLVPRLADFAVIYLVEGNDLVRTGGADRFDQLDLTAEGGRLGLDGGSPLHTAVRTRELGLMRDIDGDLLRRLHADQALLGGLGRGLPLTVAFVPMPGPTGGMQGAVLIGAEAGGQLDTSAVKLVQAFVASAGAAYRHARDRRQLIEVNEALGAAARLDDLPRLEGYELAAFSLVEGVTTGVSGDWHDAFLRDDGCLAFAVGDVVGHGTPAVTTMAQLRASMRAYLFEGHPPHVALGHCNDLAADLQGLSMASAIVGVLDPRTGRVELARAGHPPVIVAGGAAQGHEVASDPLLGVVNGHRYGSEHLELQPGQVMVLYTDGLVERRDRPLDDGVADLAQRAKTWAAEDAKALCTTLENEARLDPDRTDDATVLAIGRTPLRPNRWVTSIEARLEEVTQVRRDVVRHLRGAGVEGLVLADVELAVAELVANAVEASEPGRPVVVAVAVDDYRVTIAVTNGGDPFTAPDVNKADPLRPRGRGLRMVRAASARFEVENEDGATTVSCAFLREQPEP